MDYIDLVTIYVTEASRSFDFQSLYYFFHVFDTFEGWQCYYWIAI